jgi:molecular chaperone DnaJ|tara:strand:- start:858 stop:1877 length:1020 start_codon:yes stop_codon:yes gene_type:complete
MSKNYYDILGVDKTADEKTIKKSYRKLSKKYHPDVNSEEGAEDKFKDIAEAYDVLSNPEKKENYDNFGDPKGRQGNPFGGGFSAEDIFSQFGNAFGGGRKQQRRQPRGRDLRVNIKITLEEVFNGVKKKFKYKKRKKCEPCNGEGGVTETCNQCGGVGVIKQIANTPLGQMMQEITCHNCGGGGKIIKDSCKICNSQGSITTDETLEVDVPKGLNDGEIMVNKGGGDFARSGTNGDLVLQIIVLPHDKFIRSNLDLHYRLKLKYHNLILGGSVEVETIDGKIRMSIKEGTNIGETLRVPGKGLVRDNHKGDLLIETWLDIPKNPSKEYKEWVDKLKNIN